MPKYVQEERNRFIEYVGSLLSIVDKVIDHWVEFKQIGTVSLSHITLIIINAKCPQFSYYIRCFLGILISNGEDISHLLNCYIEDEAQTASIAADIKGVFVSRSQQVKDKMWIKLTTFMDALKMKYKSIIPAFSAVSCSLLKKV